MGISLANVVLLLVNAGFLVAGVLLITFTSSLKETGWTDALEGTDYESTATLAITAVKTLGIVTIVIALFGAIGAITRNRVVLMVYLIVMVIMMLVFGVIGGTAFSFKGKMKDWEDATFPAADDETSLAETFNEAYCYAQGAYYCNNATAQEAFKVFMPDVSDAIVALLPNVQGINSLCDQYKSLVSGMDSVCTACAQAKKFAKYDKILTWANDKCPRTTTTSAWCGQFLASGEPGAVYTNSPYAECREIFLGIAVDWSGKLALMGALAAVCAAFLVALSCSSRRSKHSSKDEFGGAKA
uniref:Tetraspanin n=1 Tax=Globisporangium ultimum (strain ATCC 200006 / CBS 805.95 / DAOM BR144) TaxID=431595 RepID=K3WRP4_GLOUD